MYHTAAAMTVELIMPLILVDHAIGHQDLNVFKEPLAIKEAIFRVK